MQTYSIGEFSRMSGLPVKTLRYYHDKQLLIPAAVDSGSGYRHYDARNLETAHVIVALKGLDFSLDDIQAILAGHEDDADILEFLERQRNELQGEIVRRRDIVRTLDSIIESERQARTIMNDAADQVVEKELDPLLVGGIRMRGKYADCGQGFSKLLRKHARHSAGKPMLLIYDEEYKEDDADFECCVPLRKSVPSEVADVRTIPGGKCLSVLHRGPYDQISTAYEQLLSYAKERGYAVQTPCREIYLKGPGMIFKGNPKKYLTEVQLLVAADTSGA